MKESKKKKRVTNKSKNKNKIDSTMDYILGWGELNILKGYSSVT